MSLLGRIRGAWDVLRLGAPGAVRFIEGQPLTSGGQSWLSQYGGGFTQDGQIVINETTALNISSVWAAVRVLSGAVSILPAKVYKKDAKGSRLEVKGDVNREPAALVATQPNSEMTPITFWETAMTHVLTWGNFYAEIERNSYGDPVALWPIQPNMISPERTQDTKRIIYRVKDGGQDKDLQPQNVFHVPGLGWDGLKGLSVIGMARQFVADAQAAFAAARHRHRRGHGAHRRRVRADR